MPSSVAPVRQPAITASAVSSGKKMSCPVLLLAPRMPVTRPRCAMNQRVATVGREDAGHEPGPEPGHQPEQQGQLPDLADEARPDRARGS